MYGICTQKTRREVIFVKHVFRQRGMLPGSRETSRQSLRAIVCQLVFAYCEMLLVYVCWYAVPRGNGFFVVVCAGLRAVQTGEF
jgi:hypothetical protein